MKALQTRKNISLDGHDYSDAGAYFVTICVKDGHEMLGEIVVGAITNRPSNTGVQVLLSHYGQIVDIAIKNIPNIYENVRIDKYVIMPNHIHMIILINHGRLIIAPTQKTASISTIIKGLKTAVTKQIGFSLWQKSFHDHIIRNKEEYQRIWNYIDENPARWEEDCYYKKGLKLCNYGFQNPIPNM